jgi:hypothetical protein
MASLSSLSREQLENIVRFAEWSAIVLTFLGATSGVVFILANRPLKKLEAAERQQEHDQSQAKIAESNATAARANENTAALSLKVEEEARKRAEAEKALLELQEDFAPRDFNKEEFHTLVRLLTRDPKGHIDIVVQAGNPEARGFAGWLASALHVSGWTVNVSEVALMDRPAGFSRGVGIAIRDGQRQPARLKTLHDALVGAGIPADSGLIYLDPNMHEDAIRLSVWPKPVTPRARW